MPLVDSHQHGQERRVGRLGPWSLCPFFLLILFLGFLFYPLRGKHLSWYQNTQLLGPQRGIPQKAELRSVQTPSSCHRLGGLSTCPHQGIAASVHSVTADGWRAALHGGSAARPTGTAGQLVWGPKEGSRLEDKQEMALAPCWRD